MKKQMETKIEESTSTAIQSELEYENVLRFLRKKKENVPKNFKGWLEKSERRGLADAVVWEASLRKGEITDVERGFLQAFKDLIKVIAYLEYRVQKLEKE